MALYHSARGSVNYTIVGSPTIVDGVVSGFSNSNYLTLTTIPQGSSIEFNFRFTPTETPAGAFFRLGASAYRGILEWRGNDTNEMRFSYREVGSTTTKYKYFNVPLNVPINYNMVFNSSTNTLVSTITSNNTTQVITVENVDGTEFTSTAMLGYVGSNRLSLNGTIDLNHTYIIVNGQPWFGICPIEVKKHQIQGPVGYTVVGSPTITDGVASGFSNTSYLTLEKPSSINDAEIKLRYKFDSVSSYQFILGDLIHNGLQIQLNDDSQHTTRLRYCDGTTSKNIDFLSNTEANVWYTIIVKYSGIQVVISYAKDNEDFTTNTYQLDFVPFFGSTKWIYGNRFLASGAPADTVGQFRGSIDLNETYIKVNGKLWFWQPRETERIVVNGVEVWTKPQES